MRRVSKDWTSSGVRAQEHSRAHAGAGIRSIIGRGAKKNKEITGSGEVRTRAGFPHWESSKILKSSALDHSATLPIRDRSPLEP